MAQQLNVTKRLLHDVGRSEQGWPTFTRCLYCFTTLDNQNEITIYFVLMFSKFAPILKYYIALYDIIVTIYINVLKKYLKR